MKGVIFNEFCRMITDRFGDETWEQILEQAPLQTKGGNFIAPKTYPDDDLMALVATASKVTGVASELLVTQYGRYVFPNLARLYPVFIKPGMTTKSFLKTVHSVIHVEVRKLYADASLPSFQYEDIAPDRLVMIYQSPRRLCDFAVGLLQGAAEHFNERIEQTQTTCMKRGDKACRFEIAFEHATPKTLVPATDDKPRG